MASKRGSSKKTKGQGELLPGSFAREVIDVPVSEELGESFLAYSLSVITSRAIPDVRDGLKPVQRRILYSMREMRLYPDRPHRKCAHVVGDVMAKFHPHGDSAIYDTLVRLGQDFARPVTLVDPQGNFGSLDDPPAAYRYTECRLTPAAMDLLGEIGEDTVDFEPTYDGETLEPVCLPGILPNLLVNGTSGIAVGMATNMPTHNLLEVAAAIRIVMTQRRPKPTTKELMAAVKGPDFATGATIIDDGLEEAYTTGRGTFRTRAKAQVVDITRARKGLEITELPYLVGVERVMAKINDLLKAEKISGIANVLNLSDRHNGLRLVIECKTGVNPEALLEKLYRLTPLEESFGINNVVLVDGVPTTLGLYDLCLHYVTHRLDVIVRRSEYRLRKAEERLHLVEGLIIAIDNIDLVVKIIRTSKNTDEARKRLQKDLKLSWDQAEYILELKLRRLTALAYDELVDEMVTLANKIAELKKILGSEARRRTIVLNELDATAEKYGTERRTKIVNADTISDIADIEEAIIADVPDEPCVVSLAASGLVGREPLGVTKSYTQSRHDVIANVVVTSSQANVFAITNTGRLLKTLAFDIPEVGGRSRGRDVSEVFNADRNESVLGIFSAGQGPDDHPLMLVTTGGIVKRVAREALAEVSPGRPAIKLSDRDKLAAVFTCAPSSDIVIVSSDAQALRTKSDAISIQGPGAKGVAGMSLKGTAKVVTAGEAVSDAVLITVTDIGATKSTLADELPSKGRGGSGIRVTKFKDDRRVDYAWVGLPERIVAIVGQADAPTKPDNSPESVGMKPTRRDGLGKVTPRRILAIGTLRW